MEIKYCIKAWIRNAAAVLEVQEVYLCFLHSFIYSKNVKKSFLKFQRFQSFSTVNAEDGLWKSENLFTFISFGTGIWILIFNWELMLY